MSSFCAGVFERRLPTWCPKNDADMMKLRVKSKTLSAQTM